MSDGWDAVSDQKSEAGTWVVGDVDGNETATGVGLAGLAEAFDDKKCQFAALKIIGVDQQENVTSERPKIVQINWVGPKVPVMKKMGALQGKQKYAGKWGGIGSSFDIGLREDITMVSICKKILAAGGAHKPTHYSFGAESVPLADLYNEN